MVGENEEAHQHLVSTSLFDGCVVWQRHLFSPRSDPLFYLHHHRLATCDRCIVLILGPFFPLFYLACFTFHHISNTTGSHIIAIQYFMSRQLLPVALATHRLALIS